jgi:Tfp pilus assembly protein PilO
VATSTDPKQQLSNNNLMVVMVLISLLVVGVSGFVAKSLIASIQLDKKVLDYKSAADKQIKADVKAAPKLVDAYAALGDQAGTLADALPNTADFPSLIVALENMSKDTGTSIKSVAPAVTSSAPGATSTAPTASVLKPVPHSYPFTITFDTTYATLQQLLDHFEKSARPMRVVSLKLNGSGSALSGTMDVETYYQDKAELPFSEVTVK